MHMLSDAAGQGLQRRHARTCAQVSLKVGGQFLPMSITVMEKGGDFLFGLDMLRRYQCSFDLRANALRFATEPEVALPFLAEHELPAATRFEMRGGEAGENLGLAPQVHLGKVCVRVAVGGVEPLVSTLLC